MQSRMIYMETGSLDPAFNLAFEEYVLTHRTAGNYLLLWQNNNTIVVGQNQNTAAEIDPLFVKEHHIRVIRRTTGGGAVYHDLGNLNYSFITDASDAEQITMEQFTTPIVNALRGLGLPAEASGRNDILVAGKKVSGTAQRLFHNRILHHGTLLFDSDPEMISNALRADPEKFQSKSTKSVRSRIGNIRVFLKEDMDMPSFWSYLRAALTGGQYVPEMLSEGELAVVNQLKASKYDTWEWNYGRTPKYNLSNKRRWNGGCLEVLVAVEVGKITDITFYGDFLSSRSLDELVCALRGCPFQVEAVDEILARYPLQEYFGCITQEEVLKTILGVAS